MRPTRHHLNRLRLHQLFIEKMLCLGTTGHPSHDDVQLIALEFGHQRRARVHREVDTGLGKLRLKFDNGARHHGQSWRLDGTDGKLAEVSIVITGRADLPANNLAEFLALAKAQPGKFTYATSGVGSIGHLSFELIKSLAEVDVHHVAYKGGGPAVTDLIGGHVDVVVDGAALPFVLDGKIKALATTGPRLSVLPKVPSVAESGLKGYSVTNWWCLLAPVGTPAAIVKTLSDEVQKSRQLG